MQPTRTSDRQQTKLAFLWGLIALLVLAGCGTTPQAATTAPEKTNVSIQLSWIHEYSSAPFYAAEKNSHFAEQGLEVQLQEGGFTDSGYVDPIDQIVKGTADFGMADASSLLLARAEGKPVVAIAAILQRSPLAVISLDGSGIQRPQDLVGRRVAVAEGGATRVFNTLLGAQGISAGQVEIVPRTTFGIEPLVTGEADALVAWIINEGVQVEEAGYSANVMLMNDYGVDTYDFLLFTSETMLREQPETVERTLRALSQGMQDVIGSPEQAVGYTLAYNSALDTDGQRRRLLATIPLMNPAGSRPGMMQAETWATTYQILIDQGVLRQPLDDMQAVYTMRFLDTIYAK
jgi:NitT/TauT family transport system substrate-binding protein